MTENATGPDRQTPLHDTTDTGSGRALRQPGWAEASDPFYDSMGHSVTVTHRWTAPSVAQVVIGSAEAAEACPVQIVRQDEVIVENGAARTLSEAPGIWLDQLDARFADTAQARLFAAAVVECCDRLDGFDAGVGGADSAG